MHSGVNKFAYNKHDDKLIGIRTYASPPEYGFSHNIYTYDDINSPNQHFIHEGDLIRHVCIQDYTNNIAILEITNNVCVYSNYNPNYVSHCYSDLLYRFDTHPQELHNNDLSNRANCVEYYANLQITSDIKGNFIVGGRYIDIFNEKGMYINSIYKKNTYGCVHYDKSRQLLIFAENLTMICLYDLNSGKTISKIQCEIIYPQNIAIINDNIVIADEKCVEIYSVNKKSKFIKWTAADDYDDFINGICATSDKIILSTYNGKHYFINIY